MVFGFRALVPYERPSQHSWLSWCQEAREDCISMLRTEIFSCKTGFFLPESVCKGFLLKSSSVFVPYHHHHHHHHHHDHIIIIIIATSSSSLSSSSSSSSSSHRHRHHHHFLFSISGSLLEWFCPSFHVFTCTMGFAPIK